MSAAALLSRLEKVKETGADRWVACCPAHADRSPSLSIRDDDGKVLLHCFAGCSAIDVLAAVGLDWDAVFPTRSNDPYRDKKSPPVPYRDALLCISAEAFVVLAVASKVERGDYVAADEMERLTQAVGLIAKACEITGAFR